MDPCKATELSGQLDVLIQKNFAFRSELALLYNDRCVLENHHLCSAFTLLKTVSSVYTD